MRNRSSPELRFRMRQEAEIRDHPARRRIASNSASTSVSVSLASIALGPSKLAALRRPTRCSSGTV
jgi:hypothetical protein